MNFLTPTEYNNQRILTTQQLAENYETEVTTIQQNFNNNKERYAEGKHYYFLQGDELKQFLQLEIFESQNINKVRSLYLWTERGALLHAKSLNNDTAWDIYEKLVDFYFRPRELAPASLPTLESRLIALEEKEKFRKTTVIGQLESKTLLTKFEAACYLGICGAAMKQLMKEDDFPIVRMGKNNSGKAYIDRELLDNWISEQKRKGYYYSTIR